MTTVSLDVFLPDVLPYVRDCPELVAKAAVRNAIIEFCKESYWWTQAQTPLSVIAGLAEYDLDPPTECDAVSVNDVRVSGRILQGKSADELDAMFGQDWRSNTGQPRYYTRTDAATLLLVPVPGLSVAQGLTVNLVLQPSRDAQYVDESFYKVWGEQIAYGARARLHEIPGQSYYDEGAATKYKTMFRSAIAAARAERNRGMTRGPISIRLPVYT